jgi:hypothetical protein
LTPGKSVRHARDMDQPVSPPDFVDLHAKIIAAFCDSGVVENGFAADYVNAAAIKLAWLCASPLEAAKPPGRGRPPKANEALAAAYIIETFEAVTGSKVHKPASDANERARGLEPLVRRVFGACGFDMDPKAAIAAVPKLKRSGKVIKRQIESAEEYFEWTSAKERLAARQAKREAERIIIGPLK